MSAEKGKIALQITYTVGDSNNVPVRRIGKRVEFPLGDDVLLEQDPNVICDAVREDPHVLFWVTQIPGQPMLTLVAIGTIKPIACLRLDGRSLKDSLPVLPQRWTLAEIGDRLGGTGTAVENLTVWIQVASGNQMPLLIGSIAYAQTVAEAETHPVSVKFVVLGNCADHYKAIYRVESNEVFGPPGIVNLLDCNWLRNQRNPIADHVADMKGCPR